MSFDLSNAFVSLQGYINKILAKKLDVFVIIYLDDILIYIDTVDHVNVICYILNELRKQLLYANLNKCCFHWKEMPLLDYVDLSQVICMENEQI